MSSSTKNYAWTIPSHASDITHLTKVQREIPTPGPKQVLIRLTATSLNYRDLLISTRNPAYPGNHVAGLVPGSDGAGIVVSTGPGSKWAGKENALVVIHPNTWLSGPIANLRNDTILGGYSNNGALQQFLIADDEQVIVAPKNLNGAESSALFTAGTTAWSAIREFMDGRADGNAGIGKYIGAWTDRRLEGKTVLTQGTGGVSCFAIQIAAALGATVIATSSSDSKLKIAKTLGATHGINYKTTAEWDEEVLRLTNGEGVDLVIEVGGAQTIMKSINATKRGGFISVLGILTQAETIPADFVPTVLFGAKTVRGCMSFTRDSSAEFCQFVEANQIKPVIAQTFQFEETVKAFEALQKQNSVGKLVVKISDE